jgi:hypothetical protein
MRKSIIKLPTYLLIIFGCILVQIQFINAQDIKDTIKITQELNGDLTVELIKRPDGLKPLPTLRLYEIVKDETGTKSIFRVDEQFRETDGKYQVRIPSLTPQKKDSFLMFEVDIFNYFIDGENLNFRTKVLPLVTAVIEEGNGNQLKLKFTVPKTVKGGCESARSWVLDAFDPRNAAKLSVTRSSTKVIEYKIIDREVPPITGIAPEVTSCDIYADLTLNKKLPVAEKLNPAMIMFGNDFINSEVTQTKNPSFAIYRDGIKGSIDTKAGLNEAEKRDEERKVAIEVGGGLTTKKQQENVTNPDEDRETTGFIDLRMALDTRLSNFKFVGDGNNRRLSSWRVWTPLQFEAMISEGKLEKKNLTTNTMRLFTQYQFINDTYNDTTDFIIWNLEAGAAADRDLRVIDYTGSVDFRWEPSFLNKIIKERELGRNWLLSFQIMPASVELGGRQERRDPFFTDTDTFIRRFRFSEKLNLQLPPYAQLIIEHRGWVLGEVSNNRFRNYFNTTLNLFPKPLSDAYSAGVFLSYERGTLPPFSTPSISTFKIGFRVRKREWW